MKNRTNIWVMLSVIAMTGCVAGGPRKPLSATQCRDLTEIRNRAPVDRARNLTELGLLQQAGYHPEQALDPNYPADLQAAQQKVDMWYQADCVAVGKSQ